MDKKDLARRPVHVRWECARYVSKNVQSLVAASTCDCVQRGGATRHTLLGRSAVFVFGCMCSMSTAADGEQILGQCCEILAYIFFKRKFGQQSRRRICGQLRVLL